MLRTWLVKSWRSLKPWHCNYFCANFVTCSTLSFVSYKVRQTCIVLVLFVTCMECLLGSFVTNIFEKSDVTIRIPSLVSLGAQILCGLKLLMWLSFLGDSEAFTSIYQICVDFDCRNVLVFFHKLNIHAENSAHYHDCSRVQLIMLSIHRNTSRKCAKLHIVLFLV